ncbi:MAG: RNA polymerase sigma factor [Chloroflexi bacterium]|nr:RNA polymerase sigma factor [Chloroflexota bacterium]
MDSPEAEAVTGRRIGPRPLTDSAFERRFSDARERLIALCGSLVGAQDAEDIVQDVYLVARSRLNQLRDVAAFDGWLRRIAINRCYEHHRRRSRLTALVGDLTARFSERDLDLRELVERLPPRERTIVVLHYGHGYRLDEIAEMLSLSHTNVRSIVARTRRRLAAAWGESDR